MKLVILDRDGVINHDSDAYIKSLEEWEPLAGSLDAMARLFHGGYRLAIASNQSGLGRKLFTIDHLNAIHRKLARDLAAQGVHIEGIFFCPHAPEAKSFCRKPQPGLLLQAASALHLDLARSYLVGDAITDLEAALAVGVQPLLVRTGRGANHAALLDTQTRTLCPVVNDLSQAIAWILDRAREG